VKNVTGSPKAHDTPTVILAQHFNANFLVWREKDVDLFGGVIRGLDEHAQEHTVDKVICGAVLGFPTKPE
jgi:hypothetical protein